jgi:biopolymer transport protein TolQ
METEALGLAQELDFSLAALFWRATFTVKVVMIALVLASIWAWGVIIQKYVEFARAKRAAAAFDRAFWSGEPLDDLADQIGDAPRPGAERVFAAGMDEYRKSHSRDGGLIAGVQARIGRAMDVAIGRESDRLTRGLTVLASVGASAPFIGLFGTVVGIMTPFQAIAGSESTNLAVVAPGIAEALLATALGLAGRHSRGDRLQQVVGRRRQARRRMEAFADEFSAILSRQIDERMHCPSAAE